VASGFELHVESIKLPSSNKVLKEDGCLQLRDNFPKRMACLNNVLDATKHQDVKLSYQ
jgi:hypothetical protein